jgi:hypothetical protein
MSARGILLAGAAAAASAAPPAGLYGLSPLTQLFFINATGGMQPVGAPLSDYAAGPALGAIDARAAILYTVLLKESPLSPFLVGIRLADGGVASSLRLPFADDGVITLGHLALNTAVSPTLAIVGGVNARQQHVFGTISASGGGNYRQFANLSAAWNDVGGLATVYVPATNELLVQFNVNKKKNVGEFEISVYSVSLANGTVRELTEDLAQGRDVQTLAGPDPASGRVYGLGFNVSSGLRELVELDPAALSLRVVAGNVSVDTVALNGISALDSVRRALWWVGDRGGSDEFFLIASRLSDGAELSRTALCAYGDCPMMLANFQPS